VGDDDPIIKTLDGTKKRLEVRMSNAEIADFLEMNTTYMACASMNKDRSTHLVEMGYAVIDGNPVMEAKAKSQKILNLKRDPRITCMIADGVAYGELRGVQIAGRADIIEDPEYVFASLVGVMRRHSGMEYREDRRPYIERAMRNRVAIKVNVDRYISWDHRKLQP
jgi:hypothetical protein